MQRHRSRLVSVSCLVAVAAVTIGGCPPGGGGPPAIQIKKPANNASLNTSDVQVSIAFGASAVPSTFVASLDLVDVTAEFTVESWGAWRSSPVSRRAHTHSWRPARRPTGR